MIALPLALTVIATRKDIAYGLVIAWALFGIASKQANPSIVATAQVGIIVILIASVAAAILAKPRKP